MARRTTSKTSTTKRTTTPRKPRSTKAAPETTDATEADAVIAAEQADTPSAETAAKTPDIAAQPDAEQPNPEDAAPEPDQPEAPFASPDTAQDVGVRDEAGTAATADAQDIVEGVDPEQAEPAPEAPAEDGAAVVDAASETKADAPAAAPSTPTAPAPQKSSGFIPMLLGGAVAAALGYGAHYAQSGQSGNALAALQTEIAELRAAVSQGPDLSDLQAQIAALEPAAAPDLSAVNASLDDLRAQIAALPDLQAQLDGMDAGGGVDLGPIEAQLAALQSAYAPLPDQITALQAEMADLRALATAEIAEAEAAVDAALGQAGLDRISAALVTGEAFADASAQLDDAGIAVPDPIEASAAQGVQTLEALQASFGEAARAAIAASLQTAPAESATEKLGNFFRAQIGARSLAPREGDDPDAITSRAGAAVEAGDLAAALNELAALPDEGRAAMADWLDAAQTRLDVAAALDALQADMTTR